MTCAQDGKLTFDENTRTFPFGSIAVCAFSSTILLCLCTFAGQRNPCSILAAFCWAFLRVPFVLDYHQDSPSALHHIPQGASLWLWRKDKEKCQDGNSKDCATNLAAIFCQSQSHKSWMLLTFKRETRSRIHHILLSWKIIGCFNEGVFVFAGQLSGTPRLDRGRLYDQGARLHVFQYVCRRARASVQSHWSLRRGEVFLLCW